LTFRRFDSSRRFDLSLEHPKIQSSIGVLCITYPIGRLDFVSEK
jgi:hypothetical protein